MVSTTVYGTAAELRSQIDLDSASDDALLLVLLGAASRAIDNFCNRAEDGFTAPAAGTARIYPGSGRGVQWIDECVAISAVAAKTSPTAATYTAWVAGDWIAATGDPKRPDFNRTPYRFLVLDPGGDQAWFPSGRWSYTPGFRPTESEIQDQLPYAVPTVQVTARWGYAATTPDPIKQATITMAARMYKRGGSGWADTLANADMGQLLYRAALDPDVKMLLQMGRYVRPAIGISQ